MTGVIKTLEKKHIGCYCSIGTVQA